MDNTMKIDDLSLELKDFSISNNMESVSIHLKIGIN